MIEEFLHKSKIVLWMLIAILSLACNRQDEIILDFVDAYEIPAGFKFEETVIGGLSGIDYDERSNSFYVVSDDRSERNASRFYQIAIKFEEGKIDTVAFEKVRRVQKENGTNFGTQQSDFESIQMIQDSLIIIGDEGGNLGKPNIHILNLEGKRIRSLAIDPSYIATLRPNKSFESMSFSQNDEFIYYASEAPLYEDGSIATHEHQGTLRLIEQTFEDGLITRNFLYALEKVPQKATGKPPWDGPGSDNGLSALLYLDEARDVFLTVERSGAFQSNGSFKYMCKLFKASPSIEDNGFMKKTEVFDFASLPGTTRNIEGITLGPKINGKQSVFFISDNNFKEGIPSVLYLFTLN